MVPSKLTANVIKVAGCLGENLRIFDAYSSVRRALTHSEIAILTYHNVDSQKYPWFYSAIKPDDFERQIAYLGKVAQILPLKQLLGRLSRGEPVPVRTVSITFDDGYRNSYTCAYPILQKYNVPATIFLTTGYIGGSGLWPFHQARFAIWNTEVSEFEVEGLGRYQLGSLAKKQLVIRKIEDALDNIPGRDKDIVVQTLLKKLEVNLPVESLDRLTLSWDEIQEMGKNRISFGAHGVTHTRLTKLPVDEATEEIAQSKKEIEKRLGQECSLFAYPDGDFNDQIVQLVRDTRFKYALTTLPGMITAKSDPFRLKRINAGRDFYRFKALLSGIYFDVLALRRWRKENRHGLVAF